MQATPGMTGKETSDDDAMEGYDTSISSAPRGVAGNDTVAVAVAVPSSFLLLAAPLFRAMGPPPPPPPPSETTGFWFFAECRPHSAKPALHSAKALPSAALGKEHSVKNSSAKNSLPSATCLALGKVFTKCHVSTRQS